jgi:hypothetical protein
MFVVGQSRRFSRASAISGLPTISGNLQSGTSQRCHQETFRDLFDYLAGAGDADGRQTPLTYRSVARRAARRRLRRFIVSIVVLLRAPLGNPQEPVSRRTLPPHGIDIHCGLLTPMGLLCRLSSQRHG